MSGWWFNIVFSNKLLRKNCSCPNYCSFLFSIWKDLTRRKHAWHNASFSAITWKLSYCSCLLDTTSLYPLYSLMRSSHHLDTVSPSEVVSACKDRKHVKYSSLIPELDVTSEYINSEPLVREIKQSYISRRRQLGFPSSRKKACEPNQSRLKFTKSPQEWKPRCIRSFGQGETYTKQGNHSQETRWDWQSRWKWHNFSEFLPLFAFQSLGQSDLEEFTYFFPEDHTEEVNQEFAPTWPTPSGLTEYSTLAPCEHTLATPA